MIIGASVARPSMAVDGHIYMYVYGVAGILDTAGYPSRRGVAALATSNEEGVAQCCMHAR